MMTLALAPLLGFALLLSLQLLETRLFRTAAATATTTANPAPFRGGRS